LSAESGLFELSEKCLHGFLFQSPTTSALLAAAAFEPIASTASFFFSTRPLGSPW
jgi:hypothetical protein